MSHARRYRRLLQNPPLPKSNPLIHPTIFHAERSYHIVEYNKYRVEDSQDCYITDQTVGHYDGYICWRFANEELKRLIKEDPDYWHSNPQDFIMADVKPVKGTDIQLLSVVRSFSYQEAQREPGVPKGERIVWRQIVVNQSDRGAGAGVERRTNPIAPINPRINLPTRSLPLLHLPPAQPSTTKPSSSPSTNLKTAPPTRRNTTTTTTSSTAAAATTKIAAQQRTSAALSKATATTHKATASSSSTGKGAGRGKRKEKQRRIRSPELADEDKERFNLISKARAASTMFAKEFKDEQLAKLGLPPLDFQALEAWLEQAKVVPKNVRERED